MIRETFIRKTNHMNIDWKDSVHSVSINYIASDCMGTQQTTIKVHSTELPSANSNQI